MQIPDQILGPYERHHSVFVDHNNQYDLREARELEQASLQLTPADQKKFGMAFTKFPKVTFLMTFYMCRRSTQLDSLNMSST